jgi:hypothetical protein
MMPLRRTSLLCLGLILTATMGTISAEDHDRDRGRRHDDFESRIEKGFRITPVRLKFNHRFRPLVGLGSYIVNAQGGCNDCHTNPPYLPGGDPHNGEPEKINAEHYLAGGVQFGPFTSRNITPDASGRPAGLTFKEFVSVMRTGHDPDNPSYIFQVMPWPVYGKMTDLDLLAVYSYLSSIPHAEPGP